MIVFNFFLFPAKADDLADEQPRNVHIGSVRAQPEGFAVGKAIHPERFADAKALPHHAVNVRLGAAPQADAGQQIQRNGFAGFTAMGQTVQAGILRGKSRITLRSVGVLDVPVPVLLIGRLLDGPRNRQ